jgi:hypothetical protein
MIVVEELEAVAAPSLAWDFVEGFGIGVGIAIALGC